MKTRVTSLRSATLVTALTFILAPNSAVGSESYRFVRKWGALAPAGAFNSPFAIAVDAQGNIFVGDMQNSRIEKFDSDGNFLLQWGKLGHGKEEFWLPQGVAVDAGGTVFVTDTFNNRVQVFTNDGDFIRAWGSQCTGNSQFQLPAPLALDSSGNVFVANGANNRVQKFTHEGKFITTWGSLGTGNGQFNVPLGVAVKRKRVRGGRTILHFMLTSCRSWPSRDQGECAPGATGALIEWWLSLQMVPQRALD